MDKQNLSDFKRSASAGQVGVHSSPAIEREAWLHENPNALASVQRGLEQSANGETQSLGSFAQFAKDDLINAELKPVLNSLT